MIERKNDGVILVTGSATLHCGMWVRCKARRSRYRTCAMTHRIIIGGDLVYRPLTNGVLRGQRILAVEAEKRFT